MRSIQSQHEIVLWELISWYFPEGKCHQARSLQQLKRKDNQLVLLCPCFHDQKESEGVFLRAMLPDYLDFLAGKDMLPNHCKLIVGPLIAMGIPGCGWHSIFYIGGGLDQQITFKKT